MKFSATTCGFYSPEIHGENMPADAIEISVETYEALLEGQAQGKRIAANGAGRPVLIDPPPITPEQVASIVKAQRAAAYQAEADPIFFKSQRGEATNEEWLAKVAEIKARYPDGVLPS